MTEKPLPSKRFQKHQEHFTCQQCGQYVIGNGYTNHCPECFTSKHVDIQPGDRLESCGGLMPVEQILFEHGTWSIVHCCERCGHRRNNKVQPKDNMTQLAALQKVLNSNKRNLGFLEKSASFSITKDFKLSDKDIMQEDEEDLL